MLTTSPWPGFVLRFGLGTVAVLLLGLVTGHLLLVALLAALAVLAYHGRQVLRLERWLRHGRRLRPPKAEGLWGSLYDSLYRLQRRHRRRRLRLARLLRRFRESANAMPDATVVLRDTGEMQWWNGVAGRYLGLQWPRDQGQRVANLLRHPDFAEFLERGDWHTAVKVPSPVDSRRVLEVRVVPYGEHQQLLLAREVTRLHRLETMRRDFVGNITHELRTPLTVLRGMSEQLSDLESPSADDLRRPLELMDQQIERMGRLVDDLLLLSRLETAAPEADREPVDVPALLGGLMDEARTMSEGRHTLTLDADGSLLVEGDESELRSAFSNLLTNAVKYTDAGGRVDVRWFVAGGAACLTVADTGRGIPAHHLPRLTERFYRVDGGRATSNGGTGLGLAIVKHVLSRHDAYLEVTSEVEVGSTFSCVFSRYLRRADGRAPRRKADRRS